MYKRKKLKEGETPFPQNRKCLGCGAVLSGYNPEEFCSSCQGEAATFTVEGNSSSIRRFVPGRSLGGRRRSAS